MESMDIDCPIGEVDVAYTHEAAADDYVYDIWFKVRTPEVAIKSYRKSSGRVEHRLDP